jgi:hypothetical protein
MHTLSHKQSIKWTPINKTATKTTANAVTAPATLTHELFQLQQSCSSHYSWSKREREIKHDRLCVVNEQLIALQPSSIRGAYAPSYGQF